MTTSPEQGEGYLVIKSTVHWDHLFCARHRIRCRHHLSYFRKLERVTLSYPFYRQENWGKRVHNLPRLSSRLLLLLRSQLAVNIYWALCVRYCSNNGLTAFDSLHFAKLSSSIIPASRWRNCSENLSKRPKITQLESDGEKSELVSTMLCCFSLTYYSAYGITNT